MDQREPVFHWKICLEHGNTAAVRNFQKQFPSIKRSTVREFQKRYEKQLQEAKKRNLQPPVQRLDGLCFWKNLILWSKNTSKE